MHYIHVHEYLHCMHVVYAIPSLNKGIIIIIIIMIMIIIIIRASLLMQEGNE